MSSPKSIKSTYTTKAKIGRHGLEPYYNDFNEVDFNEVVLIHLKICVRPRNGPLGLNFYFCQSDILK